MDPVLAVVLRGALALLLVVAALHKLRDRSAFEGTLVAYALLPSSAIALLARVVPVLELIAAALLVAPRAAAAGGVLATALLAVYAGAMGINLLRGRRDLDCGCMGPGARRPVGVGLIVRNLILMIGALVAGFAPLHGRALVWVDFLTVPLAIVALAALYAALDRVLALAPTVAALRADVRASLDVAQHAGEHAEPGVP
jgi:hypothetical protein